MGRYEEGHLVFAEAREPPNSQLVFRGPRLADNFFFFRRRSFQALQADEKTTPKQLPAGEDGLGVLSRPCAKVGSQSIPHFIQGWFGESGHHRHSGAA